ncbi:MAG: TatD family hydrolase [bacterium]
MNTTYIDTHCHLNFKRFNKTREQVLIEAQKNGVTMIIVPGTDISSSQNAVGLATQNEMLYAAIGIHPHHTFDTKHTASTLQQDICELEKLIIHAKVIAVGEVGLDAHAYEDTKYPNYQISSTFMEAQKEYFIAQIRLAKQYKKSLIIHNRETKNDLLTILAKEWSEDMRFRSVFHCCEPDDELFEYAKIHNIFIGVDGDVTYGGEKAAFVQNIPLSMLVLETDSPFLLPEPLRAQKLYPNTPATIPLIAQCIAKLKGITVEEVAEVTTRNARKLFRL